MESGFEPPRTPVEEQVAEIWSAVLGRPRVGAHDDFFSLGGHSLLAVRMVPEMNEVRATRPKTTAGMSMEDDHASESDAEETLTIAARLVKHLNS